MAKRGGFPGGMPGNMNNLMKQAQTRSSYSPDDVEMLEDLIVAATNEAFVNAKKKNHRLLCLR